MLESECLCSPRYPSCWVLNLLVQCVEYMGCVRGQRRHWDSLTFHPPPLHLKTFVVVSRNPSMLRAVLTWLSWEGKRCIVGRKGCLVLSCSRSWQCHLTWKRTLCLRTLCSWSCPGLSISHSPLLCIFLNIHPFHTQPDKELLLFSFFLFSKFQQIPRPPKPKHRIPHCWFLIKVYPRNTHPTKAFDCSTVPVPVDAPGMSQLMVWPEKEERSKATADSETEEVATASVILYNPRGRGVASIATGC